MSAISQTQLRTTRVGVPSGEWSRLFRVGGAAALLQLVTVLLMLAAGIALGPKPVTALEYFTSLQSDRVGTILRDDFTSLVMIALYLGTFPALYVALKEVNRPYTALAALFTFVAVATCFATHSGFALIHLADRYAVAASEAQRAQLLAAGEAVIASDMWNSSGAYMAGMLLQGSGVLVSAIMLRSKEFSRVTAYAGLLANAVDLAQHLLHPFAPSVSAVLIMFAGPAYLIWFPMLARDMLRLGRR